MAVVPTEIGRLLALGLEVVVEAGAGLGAGLSDRAFSEAGASIASSREEALRAAHLLVMVGPPSVGEAAQFRPGSALVSLLPPAWYLEVIEQLRVREVTSFSFNLVPRISRAQAMDALSSQASVAGYQAVVAAAARLPRMFPMVMSAAGTVPPARVLVIGAGVAGLQAIATARRLGASVSGYDVRPEAAEEIRSLGATPIRLPLIGDTGTGGYAAEQTERFTARQQELLASAVSGADVVITTAAVPGRPAPKLINASMIEAMRPGALILDLASPSGGNCEFTVDGAEIEHSGVTIIGAGDLASDVAVSASSLYARNVSSFVGLLVADGELRLDFDDEIVGATCITTAGAIRHEPTRQLMEGAHR